MESIKEYYECGEGWYPLILQAIGIVQEYNNKYPEKEPVKFTDIKEKWGYLNFYLNYYPDELDNKLLQIEEKSKSICESCGKPAKSEEIHGWIYTLCDDCKKKELLRYENLFK